VVRDLADVVPAHPAAVPGALAPAGHYHKDRDEPARQGRRLFGEEGRVQAGPVLCGVLYPLRLLVAVLHVLHSPRPDLLQT